MNSPFSKSLSLRLLAIFLVTAISLILLLASLFRLGLSTQWQQTIQPHLSQYIGYIRQEIGNPPDVDRAQALTDTLPIEIYIFQNNSLSYATNGGTIDLNQLELRSYRPDSNRKNRRWNRTDPGSKTDISTSSIQTQKKSILPDGVQWMVNREKATRYLLSTQGDHKLLFEFDDQRNQSLLNKHSLVAIASFLGVLALSYWIIRSQLSPIRKIQRGVKRMSAGELNHRIDVKGRDDLANLTTSINGMAGRIEHMLDAKRQLLLAISHELRSPLARARVATEMLPESVNRTRLIDDLSDMDSMIHDIMESERLSENHAALHKESVQIAALINQVIQSHPDQAFSVAVPESLEIQADKARVQLLLRNLINNACEHGASDTAIEIQANSPDERGVEITVSDFGRGIDPSQLIQITEPFYRPDESRSRATGGFGLGLTLAKLIAEAHGGTLTVSSNPEQQPGTRVTAWLPRW